MTPPKTITQIQLEHGLCRCHEAYKSRDMDDPDCPMHSFAVEEAMEVWGEIRAVDFTEWMRIKKCKRVAAGWIIGGRPYVAYTLAALYAIYIKETSKP